MVPLLFAVDVDKLCCRRYVGNWVTAIKACDDGDNGHWEGAHAALGMILYCSLPSLRQKLVKKLLETGDLILDSSDLGYCKDAIVTFVRTILIVAKDSAPDTIEQLARLSKHAVFAIGKIMNPSYLTSDGYYYLRSPI